MRTQQSIVGTNGHQERKKKEAEGHINRWSELTNDVHIVNDYCPFGFEMIIIYDKWVSSLFVLIGLEAEF